MTTIYSLGLRLWEGQAFDPAIKAAWGLPNSTNFTLIDQAINQQSAINLSGLATYALTTNNGAADQARSGVLIFQSATQACVVTLPNVNRVGWAINTGAFTVTLTAGSGTQAVVPADGLYHLYVTDGAGNATVPTLFQAASAVTGSSLNITGPATITGLSTLGAVTASGAITGATVATVGSTGAMTCNGAFKCVGGANFAGLIASGTISGLAGNFGQSTWAAPAGTTPYATATINPGLGAAGSILNINSVPIPPVAFNAVVINLSTVVQSGQPISNFMVFEVGGGIVGAIQPTSSAGTAIQFISVSDQALKISRGRINDIGGLIDRLRPRWFNWRKDPNADPEPGFFAQEVYRVWKWAVVRGKGRKGQKNYVPWQMDNAKLIPLLVAEIQDLRRRVAVLESQ